MRVPEAVVGARGPVHDSMAGWDIPGKADSHARRIGCPRSGRDSPGRFCLPRVPGRLSVLLGESESCWDLDLHNVS